MFSFKQQYDLISDPLGIQSTSNGNLSAHQSTSTITTTGISSTMTGYTQPTTGGVKRRASEEASGTPTTKKFVLA